MRCSWRAATRAIAAACIALALSGAALAQSTVPERRVALVIGNGAYETAPLRNPPNDARLMARTLRSLQFEVIERIDADQRTMRRAIIDFSRRLEQMGGDGVGVVYYAGHGVQSAGRNYLMPVGARVESEAELRIEAVSADELLEAMEGARNRLNIVILDACRDNPYARSFRSAARGLARLDAPRGTLIAYATRPGQVAADGAAANSPYTDALARAIATPGLPLTELFIRVRNEVMAATRDMQTPWEEGGLTSQFYFAGRAPAAAGPAATAPAQGEDARRQALEDEIRRRVEDELRAEQRRKNEASQREQDNRARLAQLTAEGDAALAARDRKGAIASFEAALALAPGSASLAERAARARALVAAGDALRDTLRDGTPGPELVVLPAGRFEMGELVGVKDQYAESARPARLVTIRTPFAIGRFEVTYEEYDRFTAATGRPTHPDFGWGRGRRPVVKVPWDDALAYVRWLSEQTGKRYRIPSEAEWEYAARAGTRTHFWWGNEPSHEFANYGKGQPGWFPDGVVSGRDQWMYTAPVGQFPPNPFGLYDMQGNAWEWVADCYHDDYNGAPTDGRAWGEGNCANRVMRGGSFGYNPDFMRASARIKVFWGVLSFLNYGIRVVREID